MLTEEFDYILPEHFIAQYPLEDRDASKMLVLDRATGKCDICTFGEITHYFESGDCMVFNNTRVINARMFGVKERTENTIGSPAEIEILLVTQVDKNPSSWQCLLRPAKRVTEGTKVYLKNFKGELTTDFFTVRKRSVEGTFEIDFCSEHIDKLLNTCGHVPLPPYIKRQDEISDRERYQTLFAESPGAVAAPTAGLHFTPDILAELKEIGVNSAAVTLHVGPGTFKPVSATIVEEHKMHVEEYRLPVETAEKVNETHCDGKKVIAIGTTSVRTLESCADMSGNVTSGEGETDIFIHPPYKPKVVDMLLTNFHLPKSSLLMLVCAFAKKEYVLAAYELAKKEQFRFYSYGDCMLLI